jgi:hypothetical protein
MTAHRYTSALYTATEAAKILKVKFCSRSKIVQRIEMRQSWP